KDTTPLSIYHKYLQSADLWRRIAEHNLLKDGVSVRIPKDMLKQGRIPAKVTKFSGNVEVARNFDWKWVKVVPDMLVQEGDWVRTRGKSSVEIVQDGGTVIVLRPNSMVLFEANGETETARGEIRTTRLKLEKGSILSRVRKLAQRDSRFEISTPTATSFIRGTEFRVKVEPEGTRLEVLEGRVDFGDADHQISVDADFGSLVNAQGARPEAPHALPAAPAELLCPENRVVLEGDLATYDFEWSSVRGAARYHLELATDAEFKELVDETWVEGTSARVQSLDLSALEPGTYFWRVSTLDAQNYESAWSETSPFIYPMKLR
ncbi:MAG: FecR family protein, partial [Vicinamibacteria bacterium]